MRALAAAVEPSPRDGFPRPPEVGRGGVFSGDHTGLAEPCPAHRSSPRSSSVSMVTARAEWAGRGKTAFRGGACGGSGVRALRGAQVPEMLRAGWLRLYAALCSLLLGRAEAPSPGVPPEQSRPYAVLRGQNLVLMGTIFSILLVTVILMAFCVYKPIRRR
ncbi:uncharacterized protein C12orf76 homolog [Arvicanthis niloticus]|uniref:uncharacterized protein LOC117697670 n=1 Tax=Arvicanthis niloticus TaxID=61156 RepID=UPI00402B7536